MIDDGHQAIEPGYPLALGPALELFPAVLEVRHVEIVDAVVGHRLLPFRCEGRPGIVVGNVTPDGQDIRARLRAALVEKCFQHRACQKQSAND